MIKFKCIGSGSSGNCYLLSASGRTLIVDCGMPYNDILNALDFDLTKVDGFIATHEHQDHSKSVNRLRNSFINGFTPYEKREKKPCTAKLGIFEVTALPMLDRTMTEWQHTNGDGTSCPCYAFLVEVDGHKLFYVTDTKLCVWWLRKHAIDHFLIGLNYEDDMLNRDEYKTAHKLTGHLGLETVKGIIEANRTDSLANVILCHLGGDSADRDKCIGEVEKVARTANLVDCAAAGKEWELLKKMECPF